MTARATKTRSRSRPPSSSSVTCDVHPWMSAGVAVFDHPYFAVTGDDGVVRDQKRPARPYTLVARHERYGEQPQNVTVDRSSRRR